MFLGHPQIQGNWSSNDCHESVASSESSKIELVIKSVRDFNFEQKLSAITKLNESDQHFQNHSFWNVKRFL